LEVQDFAGLASDDRASVDLELADWNPERVNPEDLGAYGFRPAGRSPAPGREATQGFAARGLNPEDLGA
jgi:hypothetical protein